MCSAISLLSGVVPIGNEINVMNYPHWNEDRFFWVMRLFIRAAILFIPSLFIKRPKRPDYKIPNEVIEKIKDLSKHNVAPK